MCPPKLERIGRSIAESCNGLPLLIKTTAGIVAKRERSKEAWEEIKKLFPYWSIAEDKDEEFIKPNIQTGISKVASAIEPEDVGEQYLKELVDRKLVQVMAKV
ncbi:hypothetical protein PIB30_039696 [Stylosanthes scabra]|uniref:NB-ARC domain-containing protein n=1 Tax=Stylosanthes scabra TaxID=79078 RepID=A0ABU6XFD1_9FABA|nr:hypothetical protein [Stylosanthes scabra]